MSTTREEIRKWLNDAKMADASHVIVVCDTYDYSDYPVFVKKTDDIHQKIDVYHGKNMQRIMEIYNLNQDIEQQLNQERCWNV